MDHDIEQLCGVPERLGSEVEFAVLEGVPMVREALVLHRPTGTVLSADLLLAMDRSTFVSFDPRHVSMSGLGVDLRTPHSLVVLPAGHGQKHFRKF